MTDSALKTIPSEILVKTIEGLNLCHGSLADQLGDQLTLITFLRHFGCPFCKQTIADLRKINGETPGYPPVLFVSQCTLEETAAFFAEHWPEASVIADPEKHLYNAFGLRRGSFGQIFGLQVWTCVITAMSKGHFAAKPVGDPWLMPGTFLARGAEIVWSHPYRHQGDLPDWNRIPEYGMGGVEGKR